MNTYAKYCPNVFLAKCPQPYQKGDTINVTTKHGKENECVVFNLILEKDGFFYYSIVRADGFDAQEWARRKAERLKQSAKNSAQKGKEYYAKSHAITDHIPMGQPILVGHHSEGRHRRDLDRSWKAMGKFVELSDKAENYEARADYWEKRAEVINLSMPESVDFYKYQLESAIKRHEGLKNGSIPRAHSFSLTYAKKEVNELEKKLMEAIKLWE
jgi:hypothetical protein